MKLTFTFSDHQAIRQTQFDFPESALDCKDQILELAGLIGKLTEAALSITTLGFERLKNGRYQRVYLEILAPRKTPVPDGYLQLRGTSKRYQRLRLNVIGGYAAWAETEEQQAYDQMIKAIAGVVLRLLKTEPVQPHLTAWEYFGFHAWWHKD